MAPNIVFVPNIRRTQNTDTGRKTQTQLIIGFLILYLVQWRIQDFLRGSANPREGCADLLFGGAEVLGIKLHEHERIWINRGDLVPSTPILWIRHCL